MNHDLYLLFGLYISVVLVRFCLEEGFNHVHKPRLTLLKNYSIFLSPGEYNCLFYCLCFRPISNISTNVSGC